MKTSKTLWSLLLGGALVTAACGDAKSSMNPVAPTAVLADGAVHDESGGAISTATAKGGNGKGNSNNAGGNGNGNGNNGGGNGNGNSGPGNGKGNGNVDQQPTLPGGTGTSTNTTPTTTRKVEIEGMISAKGSAQITVNAQDVDVPATAVIRHGDTQFTFSDLHVGDRVHVKGMRTTTGAGALATTKIEASEVKLQNPGEDLGEDDGDDDGTTPPVTVLVSVSALDATASETGPDLGAFQFTRSGATATALTVTITLTGTATNGTDYQSVPLTVTFAAGQTTANVFVVPMADAIVEGAETVVVTVVDGTGYAAGAPATATVTIAG